MKRFIRILIEDITVVASAGKSDSIRCIRHKNKIPNMYHVGNLLSGEVIVAFYFFNNSFLHIQQLTFTSTTAHNKGAIYIASSNCFLQGLDALSQSPVISVMRAFGKPAAIKKAQYSLYKCFTHKQLQESHYLFIILSAS